MKLKISMFILLSIFALKSSIGQTKINIWNDVIPNRIENGEKEEISDNDIIRIGKVQIPTIEVYLPAKKVATGQGVIICPGGGYHYLAYDYEGQDVAKYLNSKGIAAFVLKYRLPESESLSQRYDTPLLDALRAIRMVRNNAEEYHLDKNKIGIMGFSAGGHLVSTVATHFDYEGAYEKDLIDEVDARPDFVILIYPVVSMDPEITHKGSRNALIGENPTEEMQQLFSNELQVKDNTPPVFIVHSQDDKSVPIQNSLRLYNALTDKGIQTEIHIYPHGGHGYSMGSMYGRLGQWPDLLSLWLNSLNIED